MKKLQQSFGHVPKYSKVLLTALKTPLLIFFAVTGNVITFGSASLFLHFERHINPNVQNYFDALYWSFASVSTVGYGDLVPVTLEGRMIGMFLMVFGVLFIIGFTAILVSVVYGLSAHEMEELQQVNKRDFQMLIERLERLESKLEK